MNEETFDMPQQDRLVLALETLLSAFREAGSLLVMMFGDGLSNEEILQEWEDPATPLEVSTDG